MVAKIEDSSGNIESNNGVYTCSIELLDNSGASQQSNLNGTLLVSASSGTCTFNNLKITSVGTYVLKVSSTIGAATISDATSSFAINQAISYIIISETTATLTVYFLFNITVNA